MLVAGPRLPRGSSPYPLSCRTAETARYEADEAVRSARTGDAHRRPSGSRTGRFAGTSELAAQSARAQMARRRARGRIGGRVRGPARPAEPGERYRSIEACIARAASEIVRHLEAGLSVGAEDAQRAIPRCVRASPIERELLSYLACVAPARMPAAPSPPARRPDAPQPRARRDGVSRRDFRGRVVGPATGGRLADVVRRKHARSGSPSSSRSGSSPCSSLAFVLSFASRLDPPSFRRSSDLAEHRNARRHDDHDPLGSRRQSGHDLARLLHRPRPGPPAPRRAAPQIRVPARRPRALPGHPRLESHGQRLLPAAARALPGHASPGRSWCIRSHVEAAEAGDPAATERVTLAPELRRMTLVATSACLVLALALFVTLPRFRSHWSRGAVDPVSRSRASRSASRWATSVGFAAIPRWCCASKALERRCRSRGTPIGGGSPSISSTARTGRSRTRSTSRPGARSAASAASASTCAPIGPCAVVVQRILREPVESGVVFGAGRGPSHRRALPAPRARRERRPLHARPTGTNASATRSGRPPPSATRASSPRDRASRRSSPSGRTAARGALPLLARARSADLRARPTRSSRARRATSNAPRVSRTTLRREGRYTDSPPPLGDDTRSPSRHSSSATSKDIASISRARWSCSPAPRDCRARLVNGFAGGVPNVIGGFSRSPAPTPMPGSRSTSSEAGWVRFDPTPPDCVCDPSRPCRSGPRCGQLGSAVEIWWFQRVVDFDSADQIGVLRGLWRSGIAWRSERRTGSASGAARPRRASLPLAREREPLHGPRPGALGPRWASRSLAHSIPWARPRAVPVAYRRAHRSCSRAGPHPRDHRHRRATSPARVTSELPPPPHRPST